MYICAIHFLFACNELIAQTAQNNIVFSRFRQEATVTNFSNLFKFEDGRVNDLFVSDTNLFVWNGDGVENYFFSQYSLKNNLLVRKFVKAGGHKGEGLQVFSAGMLGDHLIWYYDIGLRKAVLIELPRKNAAKDTIAVYEYHLPGKYYYSCQLINRSTLLGSGSVDTGYAYIGSVLQEVKLGTNKQTREYGTMPGAPTNTPFNSWRDANQGFLNLNPSRNKAVLAKHHIDEIEIFDLKTGKSRRIKGPDNLKLEFNSVRIPNLDISGPNEKTMTAFVSAGATTEKYIYLLYLGIPSTENRYNTRGYNKINASNCILVYDWSGRPMTKLKLDRTIMGFTVSKNNKVIYAYDPDSKYVIKANLPDIK